MASWEAGDDAGNDQKKREITRYRRPSNPMPKSGILFTYLLTRPSSRQLQRAASAAVCGERARLTLKLSLNGSATWIEPQPKPLISTINHNGGAGFWLVCKDLHRLLDGADWTGRRGPAEKRTR